MEVLVITSELIRALRDAEKLGHDRVLLILDEENAVLKIGSGCGDELLDEIPLY